MCKAFKMPFLFFLVGFLNTNLVLKISAQTIVRSRVVLEFGGSPEQRERIGATLSAVLQEINRIAAGRGNFEFIREYCTPEGFRSLRNLVEQTACFSTIPKDSTKLLETLQGQYEVRGIKLLLNKDDTNHGESSQYLVFTLNKEIPEKIVKVNFAIEEQNYKRIIGSGSELADRLNRQVVLDLLVEFRNAYFRKDSTYLEQIYSDDALIIVGQVMQKQKRRKNEQDDFAFSSLGVTKIRFIKLSKIEYIERLRRAFRINAFVKVFFDDAEVMRHPKFPDIYSVNVRQRWTSSNYNDSGYLFLMFDFRDKTRPVIRVRSWQPQRFEDGTVVTLGNFDIVR